MILTHPGTGRQPSLRAWTRRYSAYKRRMVTTLSGGAASFPFGSTV